MREEGEGRERRRREKRGVGGEEREGEGVEGREKRERKGRRGHNVLDNYTFYGMSVENLTFCSPSLSLADLVEFHASELQIGGFILRVKLRRRLQTPVALRVIYTDASNPGVSAPPRNSRTQYYNVTEINDVVSIDATPAFDTFTLSVALVKDRVEGPFNSSNEVIRKSLPWSS